MYRMGMNGERRRGFRGEPGASVPSIESEQTRADWATVREWLNAVDRGAEVVFTTSLRRTAAGAATVWAVTLFCVWILVASDWSPVLAGEHWTESLGLGLVGLLWTVFVVVLLWGAAFFTFVYPWARPRLVVTREQLRSVAARGGRRTRGPGRGPAGAERVHFSAAWTDVMRIRAQRPGARPGLGGRMPVPGGYSLLVAARGGPLTMLGRRRLRDPDEHVEGQVAVFPAQRKTDILVFLVEAHRRYG